MRPQGEGFATGRVAALREPHWVASGVRWRRRIDHWVLRVGPETLGRRGWIVLRDGEIQAIGHAATLAGGMESAEQEQARLVGESRRYEGTPPRSDGGPRPVTVISAV